MLEDEIRELEERLANPEVRSSVDALERLVSDRFVEFGSSGRTYTKGDVIAQLLAAPSVTVSISDFRVLALSPDVSNRKLPPQFRLATRRRRLANRIPSGDTDYLSGRTKKTWFRSVSCCVHCCETIAPVVAELALKAAPKIPLDIVEA